jgi:anti-sigma B factor antagonist
MEIHIKKYQGAMVAEVVGEIDARTAPGLEEVVAPLLQHKGTVLLDLTRTTFMDSRGVRCALRLHREANAQCARLVLVGLCREIKDVMGSTGFLKFFQLAETLGEAVPPSRGDGYEPAGRLLEEEESHP